MSKSKIEKLVDKLAEVKEEMQQLGEEAIKDAFMEAFSKYPELTAVGWTQYTPGFNDGDPCTFGVHDLYYTFTKNPKKLWDEQSYFEESEDPKEGFVIAVGYGAEKGTIEKTLAEIWGTVGDEDLMQAIFGGENKTILVTPTKIHTEWYDPGY